MNLLGTFYIPSLNPIGPTSVIAFFLCGVFWWWRWRRSPVCIRLGAFFGPSVMFIGSLFTPLSLLVTTHVRAYPFRFPCMADYTAGALFLASGLGLAFSCFRLRKTTYLVNGTLFGLIFTGHIAYIVSTRLQLWHPLLPWAGPALALILLGLIPLIIKRGRYEDRDRRWREQKLCYECGYDLRGSLEIGRCPECGWKIPAADSQTSV